MEQRGAIHYWKMNGLGNDFVIADGRVRPFVFSPEQIRRIADRSEGIGCDQMITLEASPRADVFMRIFNADGSQVSACGNVSRCVAVLLAGERGTDRVSIETQAGMLEARVSGADWASVDMGVPRFGWADIPLAEPVNDTGSFTLDFASVGELSLGLASAVNVGNPHCIFWVDDVNTLDLGHIGPVLERHPMFPERANISLAQVFSREAIGLRVWERGAGLTKACGTAACAAAIAAARKKLTGRAVRVSLPGGDLIIEWRESDDHILMSGPVAFEHEGTLDMIRWSEPA